MNLTPGGNHINTKQLNDDLFSTAAAFSHLFLYCLCLREKEKKVNWSFPTCFSLPPPHPIADRSRGTWVQKHLNKTPFKQPIDLHKNLRPSKLSQGFLSKSYSMCCMLLSTENTWSSKPLTPHLVHFHYHFNADFKNPCIEIFLRLRQFSCSKETLNSEQRHQAIFGMPRISA